MKTKKENIFHAEMLEKLQALLTAYPECHKVHIKNDAIDVYPEQRDGANWHINWLRFSGPDFELSECKHAILEEIRLLRSSYDIKKD